MGSFYLNLGAAAAAGGWAGWLRLTGNIHEIAPGIYRAGQLGAARLTSFVREHGIKTVINLHEGNPVSAWYAAELAATAETGGHDVSLSLSANHQPGPASLTGLVATLRTAQAPLDRGRRRGGSGMPLEGDPFTTIGSRSRCIFDSAPISSRASAKLMQRTTLNGE